MCATFDPASAVYLNPTSLPLLNIKPPSCSYSTESGWLAGVQRHSLTHSLRCCVKIDRVAVHLPKACRSETIPAQRPLSVAWLRDVCVCARSSLAGASCLTHRLSESSRKEGDENAIESSASAAADAATDGANGRREDGGLTAGGGASLRRFNFLSAAQKRIKASSCLRRRRRLSVRC